MAKQGNLTLSSIKAKSKQLDKMEKFEIEEGEYAGETISFYPVFTDDKIDELLKEMQTLVIEAKNKNLELSEEMNIHLIHLLAIKHFSHFKKSMPSTLIGEGKKDGLIDWLEHFRKTGLYSLFLKEIFLPSEITKIFEALTDFISSTTVTLDLEEQIKRKAEALKYRNKDVFDKVQIPENKPLQ